jgi:hypothetical protein
MPEGRIQILTHRTEPLVWQPRWLGHPNGALGLVSVMIVVSDVAEAAQRFARFTDQPTNASEVGQSIELDRGRVDLVTPEAFAQAIPDLQVPSLPFIAAYEIAVQSLETLKSILLAEQIPTRVLGDRIIARFPEELGCGAWIFSAASASSASPR